MLYRPAFAWANMLEFIREHAHTLILGIALLALLVALGVLRSRRKRAALRLEKDASGLWRYHPDTKFTRKQAYLPRIASTESSASLEAGGRAADGHVGQSLAGGSPGGAAVPADGKMSGSGTGESPDARRRKTKSAQSQDSQKPLAVLTFRGDVRAKHHDTFSRMIDEVVLNKEKLSEVVVRMTSPGGMVSQYGHVLAEMERIRAAGLPLTVCVDVVAASGGYLASLPATKILAAPFAVVGSVGVVAFVPNFRDFLTSHRIQPRTFTAGKYKRTVTLTDDANPEEVERFQAQLESIHVQFRELLVRYRRKEQFEYPLRKNKIVLRKITEYKEK